MPKNAKIIDVKISKGYELANMSEIKFAVDSRGGDGIRCFEIKVGTDTTKFTNMRIA